MATIYFCKENGVEEFYQSNVDINEVKEVVDDLNNDPDNFIDGEQLCYFSYLKEDMKNYQFYGFSSKEEMMEMVYL